MGQLLLPRHFLPGIKPTEPVEINWSHEFAQGLIFYAIGREDLASGAVGIPVDQYGSSDSTTTHGLHGFALESNNELDGGWLWEKTRSKELHGQKFCTMAVIQAIDSYASFAKFLITPDARTGWVHPWVGATLQRDGTTSTMGFSYRNAGAPDSVESSTGYLQTDGKHYHYSVTKNDTTTVSFYRDGVFFSSGTGGDMGNDHEILQDIFLTMSRNLSATGNGLNGRNSLLACWGSPSADWNAGKHARFYADPYALLKPKVARVYFFLSDTTGVALQRVVVFTQIGTGIMLPSGSIAQTVEPLAQAASGEMEIVGISAQTLEEFTQISTGAQAATGEAAQTLELLEQVVVGLELFQGAAAQTLELLVQVAAGLELFKGTSEQTLELLTQVSLGKAEAVGSAAQTLELVTQLAAGVELFTGTADQVLELFTQVSSGSHSEGATGTAAQVLELLTQVVAGIMHPSGTVVQTLELLTQLSTGALQPSGTAAQTLEELLQSGVGTALSPHFGTFEQTLELLTQAAVGLVLAVWNEADPVTGTWSEESVVTGGWTEEDAVTDGWTEEDSL